MSFGGGPSRKDLLDTIESQKKQLAQYQTRFKDVVRAYKSLLKEKEALEASLKVLTVTQEVDLNQTGEDTVTAPELAEDGCSLHSEDSVDTAASVETSCEITGGHQNQEVQDQAVQIQEVQAEVREIRLSGTFLKKCTCLINHAH